jgi:FKBP-type peptidyl-prolyl cis-trans isomerase FklB
MKLRLPVLISGIALSALSTSVFAIETANSPTTPSPATAMTASPTISSNPLLKSDNDKVSYAIGVDIGRNFKNRGLTLNPQALQAGVEDGLSGAKTQISPDEMQNALTNFQKNLTAKQEAQMAQVGSKNLTDGDAYLAQNKTKPGVITLADGLQYKIIKAGEGTSPTDNDTVTVNYTGTFINGKVFDSSYVHGKPVSFPVSQVIPGWTEALKLMKPGAVWELAIPPALAYGDKGAGPIGPNETLLFKVELIAVTPQKTTSATR